MSLTARSILITGAAGGLGRALAAACVRAGATVGLGYRGDPGPVTALAAELTAAGGGRALPVPCEVRDPAAVAAAVAAMTTVTGRLDALVNNAAVPARGLLVTQGDAELREALEVNLLGVLFACRAALPVMMAQRGGVILNLGSAVTARPFRGQAVYAATKGALEALTRALAVEYGRKGIRVHCLRPGPIDTAMLAHARAFADADLAARVPLGRLGRPEEVAAYAVFLLGDDAAYVTGAVHDLDGGYGGGRGCP